MKHQLKRIDRNHPKAKSSRTVYQVYDDGHVIAYGPERDGPRPGLWIASLWSAHPLEDEGAKHITHLAADSTWKELTANIEAWERGDD